MKEYLPPGVSIHLKMYLQRPEFYLITADTETYNYHVTKATLYMTYLTVKDNVFTAYENALAKKMAFFSYPRTSTKTFILPEGSSSASLDKIITDGPWDRMVILLISNENYAGSYKTTPLYFRHFGLDFIALTWEGRLITGQAFTPRLDDEIKPATKRIGEGGNRLCQREFL